MNRRQLPRNAAPAYAWTCHVCDASNPAGQGSCLSCGNAANISMTKVAAARSNQPVKTLLPAAYSETLESLDERARSLLASIPRFYMPKKRGRIWFYAAGVCGVAVLIAGILLWGAGGPLLPGAGAPTVTPARWNLSDGTVLASIAVVLLGLPVTALLAVIGIAFRIDSGDSRRSTTGRSPGSPRA